MPQTVTILGATGLVGRACVGYLLADPRVDRVVAVGRHALRDDVLGGGSRAKLVERVIDMDRLPEHADAFASHAVICALGTTMKAAGSREAFRRVDHDLPAEAARLALDRGARHYLLVSATGANSGSRFFYNRVKGDVERDVLALPFPSTTIVRPSLLLGPREESRPGESLAKAFGWMLPGRLRAVRATDVARVLVERALTAGPGTRVIESEEIRVIARDLKTGEER